MYKVSVIVSKSDRVVIIVEKKYIIKRKTFTWIISYIFQFQVHNCHQDTGDQPTAAATIITFKQSFVSSLLRKIPNTPSSSSTFARMTIEAGPGDRNAPGFSITGLVAPRGEIFNRDCWPAWIKIKSAGNPRQEAVIGASIKKPRARAAGFFPRARASECAGGNHRSSPGNTSSVLGRERLMASIKLVRAAPAAPPARVSIRMREERNWWRAHALRYG